MNQIVQDLHPVVANPHAQLTAPTEEHGQFAEASHVVLKARNCLPLSGKILKGEGRPNILGQRCRKDSKTG